MVPVPSDVSCRSSREPLAPHRLQHSSFQLDRSLKSVVPAIPESSQRIVAVHSNRIVRRVRQNRDFATASFGILLRKPLAALLFGKFKVRPRTVVNKFNIGVVFLAGGSRVGHLDSCRCTPLSDTGDLCVSLFKVFVVAADQRRLLAEIKQKLATPYAAARNVSVAEPIFRTAATRCVSSGDTAAETDRPRLELWGVDVLVQASTLGFLFGLAQAQIRRGCA